MSLEILRSRRSLSLDFVPSVQKVCRRRAVSSHESVSSEGRGLEACTGHVAIIFLTAVFLLAMRLCQADLLVRLGLRPQVSFSTLPLRPALI